MRITCVVAAVAALAVNMPTAFAAEDKDLELLREELQGLQREYERRLADLERRLKAAEQRAVRVESEQKARSTAEPTATALDRALSEAEAATRVETESSRDLWSRDVGGRTVRLIEIGVDSSVVAGGSTVDNDDIRLLEGGAHDPRRRGFTLQQAELSLKGAVDPYVSGEAYIIASEEGVELEEAFFTTLAMPYDLQAKGGFYLTEFGIKNSTHPHAWDWIDQPVVNTRMFGGEGTRAAGVRLSALLPTPWYSTFQISSQDPTSEQMASFEGEAPGNDHGHGDEDDHADGDEEDHGEPGEGIGGFERVNTDSVSGVDDLAWMVRWVNAADLSSETSGRLGLSAMHGPNTTGKGADTWILGGDFKLSWRPGGSQRGSRFLTWQTEVMKRFYDVDDSNPLFEPGHTGDLEDWGLYTQAYWGFRPRWASGLRFEYANGNNQGVIPKKEDPFRGRRVRVSPLLTWSPSEFSKFRLQYNYDLAQFLDDDPQHTVWLGYEWQFGSHPAHGY